MIRIIIDLWTIASLSAVLSCAACYLWNLAWVAIADAYNGRKYIQEALKLKYQKDRKEEIDAMFSQTQKYDGKRKVEGEDEEYDRNP